MIPSVLESGGLLCSSITEHDSVLAIPENFSQFALLSLEYYLINQISFAIMTAITLVLRASNALNIKPSMQPLKPLPKPVSSTSILSPPNDARPVQAQVAAGSPLSIFRSRALPLELEDMWTLKRASPIFDEDDEDECQESPSKRVRTTCFLPFPEERDTQSSVRQRLPWDCKIREDENGFHLVL